MNRSIYNDSLLEQSTNTLSASLVARPEWQCRTGPKKHPKNLGAKDTINWDELLRPRYYPGYCVLCACGY
jgi:hypothetical protein